MFSKLNLKIAIVASNFIRVPPSPKDIPPGYSGAAENIIYALTEELVKRGHNVTLFASGDSKTSARLVSNTKTALTAAKGVILGKHTPLELAHLSFACQKIQTKNFDIIHSHLDWLFSFFTPFVKIPIVTTLHSPFAKYPHHFKNLLQKDFPKPYYISISNQQRQNFPELHYVRTIYHGINTQKFSFCDSPDNYFICAGRIVPDKGTHIAVEMCKKLNKKLYIAGDYPRHNQTCINYFEQKIKPHLDQKDIIWTGKWLKKKRTH